MAFATYQDVERRWRALDSDEIVRAQTLLEDASVQLAAQVEVDAEDEQQAALLKQVCCSMVIRAMLASASSAFGMSQVDYGMGPFSQNVHYANPNGDLFLTSQEKSLLGIGEGFITELRAAIDGFYGGNADA